MAMIYSGSYATFIYLFENQREGILVDLQALAVMFSLQGIFAAVCMHCACPDFSTGTFSGTLLFSSSFSRLLGMAVQNTYQIKQ